MLDMGSDRDPDCRYGYSPGFGAQYEGDTRNHALQDPYVCVVFGGPMPNHLLWQQ